MTQRVTCGVAISLDGCLAGPGQTREEPLGRRGEDLHTWMFDEPDQHRAEVDALTAAGAFVMGRHMFGPDRGDWDESWRGWWGDDPPYHAPVFVLGHRPRAAVEMAGGTTFHFVTDGIESALARAREAAGEQDVAIAGGASTINQYLAAGLIDELSLHVAPFTLGDGARLFAGIDVALEPVSARHTASVTHLTYRRRAS